MSLFLRGTVFHTRLMVSGKIYQKTLKTRNRDEALKREQAIRASLSESFRTLKGEVWKNIVGWDTYEVSDLGRVRNARSRRVLKPRAAAGYQTVTLCGKGKPKQLLIHRLVALAFIPNPESKPEVNHCKGKSNAAKNLEWSTKAENAAHYAATNLSTLFKAVPRPSA